MPKSTSVTNEPCQCDVLRRAALEPTVPVVFDSDVQEYHIVHESTGSLSGGKTMIYHCFFCGGVAPAKSKRSLMFAQLTNTEMLRLRELTDGINTVEDAVSRFGPADSDIAFGASVMKPENDDSPPRFNAYRRLVFSSLSETADVDLTDYGSQGIRFTFIGKYLGRTKDEV